MGHGQRFAACPLGLNVLLLVVLYLNLQLVNSFCVMDMLLVDSGLLCCL